MNQKLKKQYKSKVSPSYRIITYLDLVEELALLLLPIDLDIAQELEKSIKDDISRINILLIILDIFLINKTKI